MKRVVASLAVLMLAVGPCASVIAGPLTPPAGPPDSTYKTLDEVEPRLPLNQDTAPGDATGVFVINVPGSYYLTEDLIVPGGVANGIIILASDVTIDLSGYAIRAHAAADAGIKAGLPVNRVAIGNGHIDAFSGFFGIDVTSSTSTTVQDVSVMNATSHGIKTGVNALIENCRFQLCSIGILNGPNTTIRNCSAEDGLTGFNGSANTIYENCTVSDSTTGFVTGPASMLRGCSAFNLSGRAFAVGSSGAIIECVAFNVDEGVTTNFSDVTILGCTFESVNQNAITIDGGNAIIKDTRIESVTNGWGIVLTNAGESIIEDCTIDSVFGVNGTGINVSSSAVARISGCVIQNTLDKGIWASSEAIVEDCIVKFTGGTGIQVDRGIVRGCVVSFPGLDGVHALADTTIEDNTILSPGSNGIEMGTWCSATGNRVRNPPINGLDPQFSGINPTGDQNVIDSNHVSYTTAGLRLGIIIGPGNNNTFVRNVLINCEFASTGGPLGTIQGPINDLTSPWSNFEQ